MANDETLLNKNGPGEPKSPTPIDVPKPGTSAQKKGPTTRSAAASSRSPGQTYAELFAPKRFTRFYSMTPISNADLTKLNMFRVDSSIKMNIGECEKISEDYKNKGWTIEVRSKEQGEKLLQMKEMLGEPIIVAPHGFHNQSQGVITCSLLKNYSEIDIAEGLREQGVTRCHRIIRNAKSDNPEPTTTLILTFNTTTPPDRIKTRTGLSERVRP